MNHPDIIYVDEYGNIVPVDALVDKRECEIYIKKTVMDSILEPYIAFKNQQCDIIKLTLN